MPASTNVFMQNSKHGARLHSQDCQGHFEFVDGLSDFGMFADLGLQSFQQLTGGRHVFRRLFWAAWIGVFLDWHNTSLVEF